MRVLAGFQPSGKFHLGNYFGSILPNINHQKSSKQSYFIVADLHSLTSMSDPKLLHEYALDNVLDFLACGFEPDHSVLFRQSAVPEHTELFWILSTICPMGLMERAVSFKEKVERGIDASVGLFTYPILQAADILLYDAEKIPVGKDQKQHIEMTRDIAMKFNHRFGETFTIPEPVIQESVAVVPGLDGQKMSKSYGNTIPLFGDEKSIKKAIMSIVTDSKDVSEPKDPGSCIVYQIHKLFLAPAEQKTLADKYRAGGMGYGDAKKMLLEAYLDFFAPMRKNREELLKNPSYVEEVLRDGAAKAKAVAAKKMQKVRLAVGLQASL